MILYNTRGLHRKALELLSNHSSREDSPLQGTSRTVTYLQVAFLVLNSAYQSCIPSELGSSPHRVDPWVFAVGSAPEPGGGFGNLHRGHGHCWSVTQGTGELQSIPALARWNESFQGAWLPAAQCSLPCDSLSWAPGSCLGWRRTTVPQLPAPPVRLIPSPKCDPVLPGTRTRWWIPIWETSRLVASWGDCLQGNLSATLPTRLVTLHCLLVTNNKIKKDNNIDINKQMQPTKNTTTKQAQPNTPKDLNPGARPISQGFSLSRTRCLAG